MEALKAWQASWKWMRWATVIVLILLKIKLVDERGGSLRTMRSALF